MDSVIVELVTKGGPLGMLAVALIVIAYLFRKLNDAQESRLADQKAFLQEALKIQQAVSSAIERLEDITSKVRR